MARAAWAAAFDPFAIPMPWSPSPAIESSLPSSSFDSSSISETFSRSPTTTPAASRELSEPFSVTTTVAAAELSSASSRSTSPTEPFL